VPFTQTDVESSANTVNEAADNGPDRLKVSLKVTKVPLGTVTNPGADGSPVFAKDTQLDPANGPAHAGWGVMFCVGKAELLVVSEAELLIDVTVSALTTIRQPLNATNKASFFNILSSFYPDHSCGAGFINIIISNGRTLVVGNSANAMPTVSVENTELSFSFSRNTQ
jgi:hypothetical protein